MNPPTLDDWGEIGENDLDLQSAFKTFFLMPLPEAEETFASNALFYQEELSSMPSVPFNFYAPALVSYLTSKRARGDSDGASSFLHMMVWLLKSTPEIFKPETRELLIRAARRISGNQAFYAADEDIYGRFPDIYKEIQNLIKS